MKPLIVREIPVPKKFKHPEPPNEILPKHEFTLGLIAPKGCGKTTAIANLLDFYKGYFHSIYVFSPTMASDEKWDWYFKLTRVKEQKLLTTNKPLEDWIKAMKARESENRVVENAPPNPVLEGLVNKANSADGTIPEECFHDTYNEDYFKSILDQQMALVRLLKENGKSKHLANRILFIFDDLVGSNLFTSKRADFFKGFNTRHRHYSASVMMVSQGLLGLTRVQGDPKDHQNQFLSLDII